jgi:hypothetical protein
MIFCQKREWVYEKKYNHERHSKQAYNRHLRESRSQVSDLRPSICPCSSVSAMAGGRLVPPAPWHIHVNTCTSACVRPRAKEVKAAGSPCMHVPLLETIPGLGWCFSSLFSSSSNGILPLQINKLEQFGSDQASYTEDEADEGTASKIRFPATKKKNIRKTSEHPNQLCFRRTASSRTPAYMNTTLTG